MPASNSSFVHRIAAGGDPLSAPQQEEVRSVMLVFSLVLGIVPLLGIAWIVVSGTAETVDGLFLMLILLTLSGTLLLNAAWEAHTRGYLRFLRRKKPLAAEEIKAQKPQPQKATEVADSTKTGEAPIQTRAEASAEKTT